MVVRQERTVGVFLVITFLGSLGLLLLFSGLVVLIDRAAFDGGGVLTAVLGAVLTAIPAGLVRRAARRTVLARIDVTGVAFGKIRDPRFRFWSWAEIADVTISTATVRGTKIRDLRFAVFRSPRVDELRVSLPRRNIWGSGRDTQLTYQTNIRFSVGVRPRRDAVIARLLELAPPRLTSSSRSSH